jgi:protein deglycase
VHWDWDCAIRREFVKRILLLLCKGFEIYEAAAFYDVLGWSGEYSKEKVKVVTVGLQKEVHGTFGIKVISDQVLSEVKVEDFDALAIPGGFETYGYYEEAYSIPVADLILRFNRMEKPIASICVGALPLANSGILKGRQATTYHLREGLRRKQLASFGVDVADASIVFDKNIITSTSPATAMEVAFELLARITNKENSDFIRQSMGFKHPTDRCGRRRQDRSACGNINHPDDWRGSDRKIVSRRL